MLKNILKDPQTAILNTWGSLEACTCAEEINRILSELPRVKKDIKKVKSQKQEKASLFKEVKGDPAALENLKKEMQAVSQTLNSLEAERKHLESTLVDLFTPTSAEFPPRFDTISNRDNTNTGFSIEETHTGEEWDKYVLAHPQASAYHAYAWKGLIEQSFGHRSVYLLARDSEKNCVGVLPLTAFDSRLFGCFAVSVPFFNYGGPLTDSPAITKALCEHARALMQRENWQHIELRCTEELQDLPSESRKASMILSLPKSFQLLEDAFGAKVRSQYKISEKINPHCFFGKTELLDDFYRVFSRNMRDLGTPVYGKTFFKNILDTFPDQATLVVVKANNKALGAAFLFGYKDMLEIPWASTVKQANKYNINMWMYKNILNFAIEKDYGWFDFGRSTIDAGTFKFKKQWGAKPLVHYWHYILNEGSALPQMNPDNPKYKLAIAVWKRIPVSITKLIGPPLIKHIP